MAAAALGGLAVLIGAAAVSARPALFLGAGLVVFLAATAAGVAVVTRRLPAARRGRTRRVALAAGALAGLSVFVVTVLLPVGDPRLAPAPVAGQRWWQLSTGSRIAYVHLPARGPARRPTPVVFLHGGPGIADMAGDATYFGQLTQDGFDVDLRPGRHRPLRPATRPARLHHRQRRRRPGSHPPADRRRPHGPARPLLRRPGRRHLPGYPPRPRALGRGGWVVDQTHWDGLPDRAEGQPLPPCAGDCALPAPP